MDGFLLSQPVLDIRIGLRKQMLTGPDMIFLRAPSPEDLIILFIIIPAG